MSDAKLSPKQLAIGPIAASMASGQMQLLAQALAQGLDAGTVNQTQLAGAPVKGPLFEFAPAIDQFLKTHLFGDIFARDNLDWASRELATVAALSALQGVESQLLAHIRISLNVGLTLDQLRQLAGALSAFDDSESSKRLSTALGQQAHATPRP